MSLFCFPDCAVMVCGCTIPPKGTSPLTKQKGVQLDKPAQYLGARNRSLSPRKERQNLCGRHANHTKQSFNTISAENTLSLGCRRKAHKLKATHFRVLEDNDLIAPLTP